MQLCHDLQHSANRHFIVHWVRIFYNEEKYFYYVKPNFHLLYTGNWRKCVRNYDHYSVPFVKVKISQHLETILASICQNMKNCRLWKMYLSVHDCNIAQLQHWILNCDSKRRDFAGHILILIVLMWFKSSPCYLLQPYFIYTEILSFNSVVFYNLHFIILW